MEIVTGQTGEPHVTSQQDREINAAIFGAENYVLPIGEQLRCELQSSNLLRIYDGMLCMQGCIATISAGNYDDLSVESGTSGGIRKDLVCAKYEKNLSTLYESVMLTIVKGDNEGNLPVIETGNIRDGSLIAYFPLYQITVDGLSEVTVNKLFTVTDDNLGHTQKVLWKGSSYMDGGQTAQLNDLVSNQKNGIIVVFCSYNNGPSDARLSEFFIPKIEIGLLNGKGHQFPLISSQFASIGNKYLYIYDDRIIGDNGNVVSSTANGIKFNNKNYVLRYVFGV